MLSDVGWLNVISIMGILIFGCSFGIFFMYKGRKTKVRLIFYIGLSIYFTGLWYWGNFWESLYYHEDCARALSNMENACWACNEPIDKSKPSKPFEIKEEMEDIDKLNDKGKKQ